MMIVSRVRKMGSKGGIPTSFSDCLLHLSNLDLLRTVLSMSWKEVCALSSGGDIRDNLVISVVYAQFSLVKLKATTFFFKSYFG